MAQFENAIGDFFDSSLGSMDRSELGNFFDKISENSRKSGFVYPKDVNSPKDALDFLDGFVDLDNSGHLKSDKLLNSVFDMDSFEKGFKGINDDFNAIASGENASEDMQRKLQEDSGNLMKNFVTGVAQFGGAFIGLGAATTAASAAAGSGGIKELTESFETRFEGYTDRLMKSSVKAFSDIKADIIKSGEKAKKTVVNFGASVQRLVRDRLAQLSVNNIQTYKANVTAIATGSAAMAATTQMQANTEILQDSARSLELIKSKTDMLNTKLSSLYYLLQSTPVKNPTSGFGMAAAAQPTVTYKERNGIRSNELMINDIEVLSRAAKRIEKKVVGINNLESKAQSF